MKVCGQRQDAEDTMQEVLLKSVPNLPKFDNPKALMVWLSTSLFTLWKLVCGTFNRSA